MQLAGRVFIDLLKLLRLSLVAQLTGGATRMSAPPARPTDSVTVSGVFDGAVSTLQDHRLHRFLRHGCGSQGACAIRAAHVVKLRSQFDLEGDLAVRPGELDAPHDQNGALRCGVAAHLHPPCRCHSLTALGKQQEGSAADRDRPACHVVPAALCHLLDATCSRPRATCSGEPWPAAEPRVIFYDIRTPRTARAIEQLARQFHRWGASAVVFCCR